MMPYISDAIRPNSAVMLPCLQLACRHTMFLRRLNLTEAADRAIATGLFLACPGYELSTFGRLPSADTALPLEGRFPPFTVPEHRLTLAAFDRDQPVALVQIALHLPAADQAAVLLLLVPPDRRKHHVGCEVMERLSRQARRWPGIQHWYLTVMEDNTAGLAFWRHCGFRTLNVAAATASRPQRAVNMVRTIKGRPACQHAHAEEDGASFAARYLVAQLR